MKPSQRLVDVLLIVMIVLGVLNFFSPAVGIERDPLITYALVGIAGLVFGFRHGGPRELVNGRQNQEEHSEDRSGDETR